MSNTKLSSDLKWRELIKDKTFSDIDWLDTPRALYLGIDPSADSLTVGNLAVFLLAKRFLKAGWKTVLLVGGATSMVGDPGGKELERDLLSRETITKNVVAMTGQVKKLFSGESFELVDNYDWFKDIKYLEFLRDVGKNYSMTELLQRDYITERIGPSGSGISYAEFSYSLVQGYDYLVLNKKYGVELQIGGSDQWGNMLSGVPLIRKKTGKDVQAMSMPLVINKTTGKKFGKSEIGTIWLDPAKTSVLDFYQFWVNVDDVNAEDYLKIFTELTRDEIDRIVADHRKNPSARLAQKTLADQLTNIAHGDVATKQAQAATNALVSGDSNDSLPSLKVIAPTNTIDLLVDSGLVKSKSEGRRLVEGSGLYLNGQPFSGDTITEDLFVDKRLTLRRGKALKDSVVIELKS